MSRCRGQVLSFTSRAPTREAQLTSNKDWKTLCKAQRMDVMALLQSRVVCTVCVNAWVVQQNARKIGDERFRPTPTQRSVTRTDPVGGSTEFPYKNLRKPTQANHGIRTPRSRGASTARVEKLERTIRVWERSKRCEL